MMWWYLMIIFLSVMMVEAGEYHQSDYTVKMDRLQLMEYNHSYFHTIKFGLDFYNRTYRGLNASAYLLKDVTHMKLQLQVYKFLSNEYRFFPITMEINGCKELIRDTYGIRASYQKSANVELRCPFKRGLLQVTYGVINFSNFPPFIPGGHYKIHTIINNNHHFVMSIDAYAIIEEVIKKWEN